MAITAKDVMTLRQRTGLGMMECKSALTETGGDMDAAIAHLREKLGKDMAERSGREAAEGAIAAALTDGAVAMVQLQSETDFAAKNDTFIAAAQKCADLALAGPEGEFTEPTPDMQALIDNLRITIKENISLSRGAKLTGQRVGSYVHLNRKIGVIITGDGDLPDDLLKGLCQHLVAADGLGQWAIPLAIDEASLPADKKEEAKTAAIEEAKASGKPQEIAEKIATGKLRKWVDDHTLMGQVYVREMEAKKPIRDYIPKGAKITQYVKFQLG